MFGVNVVSNGDAPKELMSDMDILSEGVLGSLTGVLVTLPPRNLCNGVANDESGVY